MSRFEEITPASSAKVARVVSSEWGISAMKVLYSVGVESVGVLTRSRTLAASRLVNNQHGSMNPSGTRESTETVNESTSSSTTNEVVGTKQMLETLMAQNRMLMELLSVQQKKSSDEVTFAPDFHKSIPAFNRLNPGFQALDWLNTVNSVANLNRWPDNFKLQSVRTNLEGPARHWFLSREIVSWADFENQFKRTFVGEVSIGDRWKEMVRCVQQKSENVLEYFHEKMHLCSSLELSFSETKTQVLEGFVKPQPHRRGRVVKRHYQFRTVKRVTCASHTTIYVSSERTKSQNTGVNAYYGYTTDSYFKLNCLWTS
ncbi:hypothetical protein QTP88_026783 [Uroleucon formosanum]